jgi:hypothetical protein
VQGVPQDGQGCQEPGIEQPHPLFNLYVICVL